MARIAKGWFGQYHLVDLGKDVEKAQQNIRFTQDMAGIGDTFQAEVGSSVRQGAVLGLLLAALTTIVTVLGIAKLFTIPKARYVLFAAAIFLVIAVESEGHFGFVAACGTTAAFIAWYVEPRWVALNRFGHVPKHFFNPTRWGAGMSLLLTPLAALFIAAVVRPLGDALVNLGNEGIYEYSVSPLLLAIVAYPVGLALAFAAITMYGRWVLPARLRRQSRRLSSRGDR